MIMKDKIQWATDFGSWLLQWFLIFLAIGAFTMLSLMIAKVIDHRIWMVFAADGVFCLLLWRLCRLFRKYGHTALRRKKSKPIAVAILILFVLIAMSTWGVAIADDPRVMLNIYIFPIISIATLVFSMVSWN